MRGVEVAGGGVGMWGKERVAVARRGGLGALEREELVLDEADDCEVVLGSELPLLLVHPYDSSNIPIIRRLNHGRHSSVKKTRQCFGDSLYMNNQSGPHLLEVLQPLQVELVHSARGVQHCVHQQLAAHAQLRQHHVHPRRYFLRQGRQLRPGIRRFLFGESGLCGEVDAEEVDGAFKHCCLSRQPLLRLLLPQEHHHLGEVESLQLAVGCLAAFGVVGRVVIDRSHYFDLVLAIQLVELKGSLRLDVADAPSFAGKVGLVLALADRLLLCLRDVAAEFLHELPAVPLALSARPKKDRPGQ